MKREGDFHEKTVQKIYSHAAGAGNGLAGLCKRLFPGSLFELQPRGLTRKFRQYLFYKLQRSKQYSGDASQFIGAESKFWSSAL